MHKDVINILFSVFTGHINFTSGFYDHIHTHLCMQWPFFLLTMIQTCKLRSIHGICSNNKIDQELWKALNKRVTLQNQRRNNKSEHSNDKSATKEMISLEADTYCKCV